jgi:hypothetical protein
MKLHHRFAYYLVGLVIGSFFVAMIWSGKDTRCNYFPNARVLNDLRNKPFHYSAEASHTLSEGWVDTLDIKNSLTHGDVDFDQSNVKVGNGKRYIIEGKTSKNKQIVLEVINYDGKAVLQSVVQK